MSLYIIKYIYITNLKNIDLITIREFNILKFLFNLIFIYLMKKIKK